MIMNVSVFNDACSANREMVVLSIRFNDSDLARLNINQDEL